MVVIGLTGGIASGKSTVSRLLRVLGARVVDADVLARQVVEPGAEAFDGVVAEFGPEILRPDGTIDRPKLGSRVFGNPAALKRLGELIHPHVRARMSADVDAARHQGLPAIVLDVPLLIEGGLHRQVDQVWVVYVDPPTQAARLVARDGLTREQAQARISSQLPLDEKREFADILIDNRGSVEATAAQVRRHWQAVIATAGLP